MTQPLPVSLQAARRTFWMFLVILILFLGLSACLMLLALWCRQTNPSHESLLGGPAGFTFLAIVVALSAYLRGVASSAEQKREEILMQESKFYAVNREIADLKLKALAGTSRNLQVAAPFMILLSLVIGLRLLVESIVRLGFDWPSKHKWMLPVTDFVILEYTVMALIVLALSHHYARNRDETIREKATAAFEARQHCGNA